MIKVLLTEAQLDDLKTVLDYICEIEETSYHEYIDENGENPSAVHIYELANNLRTLTWSKA